MYRYGRDCYIYIYILASILTWRQRVGPIEVKGCHAGYEWGHVIKAEEAQKSDSILKSDFDRFAAYKAFHAQLQRQPKAASTCKFVARRRR